MDLPMNYFMQGALFMACMVAGLLFLRFWLRSRDRLFIFFAIAFWCLGLDWLALAASHSDEPNTFLYTIRLAAFLLLLIGIWDKNRNARKMTSRQ